MNVTGVLVLIATLGTFATVVAGVFFLRRWVVSAAERTLARCYADLTVSADSIAPSDVRIIFHSYHGFFIDFIQIEHIAFLPPDDARVLLWRLNRFNLTWGMLARGGPLIFFLSPLNYALQRRSVRRQEVSRKR